jgi:hypothetical protein
MKIRQWISTLVILTMEEEVGHSVPVLFQYDAALNGMANDRPRRLR